MVCRISSTCCFWKVLPRTTSSGTLQPHADSLQPRDGDGQHDLASYPRTERKKVQVLSFPVSGAPPPQRRSAITSASTGVSAVLPNMNIPMRADVVELDVVVFLVTGPGTSCLGSWTCCEGGGGVRQKLAMLDKVVLGTLRWALGVVWPVTMDQQTLNSFQLCCVSLILNCKRRPEEL